MTTVFRLMIETLPDNLKGKAQELAQTCMSGKQKE
jgi:hypothetical protein